MPSPLTDVQSRWVKDFTGLDLPAAPASGSQAPSGSRTPAAQAVDSELAPQIARLLKLSAIWHATESKIHGDVAKLHDTLKGLYDGDDSATEMDKNFQVHVDKIFATFDGTLAKDLADAAAAKTEADIAKVKADLRDRISAYMTKVSGDEVIALMDDNPFVPIKIADMCGSTLQIMLKTIA